MGGAEPGEHTYRNAAYPILGTLGIVAVACFGIGWALLAADPAAVPILAGTAAIAWVTYRSYVRTRVVSSASGVTVHNPFSTVTLRWDEIDHFEARHMLVVVHRTGERTVAWAVQAANAARMTGRRSFADDVASDLNRQMLDALGDARSLEELPQPSAEERRRMRGNAIAFGVVLAAMVVLWLLGRI
ncbi:MAG: PH domain-containing protein [Acidimicrobiales bacterium]